MLWLLSLDALAVLLQVHVGTSNKLSTRWERLRGGATTSQAILLTSGSLVTLSGAKAVVEGQKKSSEQVRACPPPHALLLQTTRLLHLYCAAHPEPPALPCKGFLTPYHGAASQERDAETFLGLALLGWGASKFSSLATGSETVYCRLNTLPIAMSLMVTNRSARALSSSRRNLLMRSLRLFGVLYTYVGFVRPWDGCLPRALAPAVPLVRRLLTPRSSALRAARPRLELPAHGQLNRLHKA